MIRVLIAEDHTLVREGIKQLLALAPDIAVAGEACNGDVLLDFLRSQTCDLVLLDMTMPGPHGIEMIKRIAAMSPAPRVLVLTMHNETQIASRALKAGASGFATKDSDPTMLLAAIRKVAAGGRYIDPAIADRMVFEIGLGGDRASHETLSEREFQIFEMLVNGQSVTDIADHLNISAKTVSTHKIRLMQKMTANSVADLVRYALEHQLFNTRV
ncbi:MAG: response regulator transcription factor [Formivibrio sp.]|nr:response regulator transcription factor [Formivibrio sp.]